jgi:hypothetical protein
MFLWISSHPTRYILEQRLVLQSFSTTALSITYYNAVNTMYRNEYSTRHCPSNNPLHVVTYQQIYYT